MDLAPEQLAVFCARAQAVADLVRLPFRRRAWKGPLGHWQGGGAGNSLDFHDHRPYSPGDDPRAINWQAYARSGQYTLKLYRQEVSPAVDLCVDLSASMGVPPAKAARTAELLYWSVECAHQSGAALRCYAWAGAAVEPLDPDRLLSHSWGPLTPRAEPPDFRAVPWRHGSLRVVISDLLWAGDPQPALDALSDAQARAVLFAPFTREEAEPDWAGNLELEDCETRERRLQRVDRGVAERYRAAYGRHFSCWETQAQKCGVSLARVDAGPDLAEALRPHLESGAVEFVE